MQIFNKIISTHSCTNSIGLVFIHIVAMFVVDLCTYSHRRELRGCITTYVLYILASHPLVPACYYKYVFVTDPIKTLHVLF